MKKQLPPSAILRRNLYWPDGMDEKLKQVAALLTNNGVVGLYQSNGEVNRTAVIRRLVDDKLRQGKPT